MIKSILKQILRATNLYYPLQGTYVRIIANLRKRNLKKKFEPFKGSGFTCNFCGSSYSKFESWDPPGADAEALARNKVLSGYGENIICPNCLSTARERLVRLMIEKSEFPEKKKILFLAPEEKLYRWLAGQAEVITGDLEPGFYRFIDPQIRHSDATALEFGNGTFDLVIANHIMEHIPNDRLAMREIFRVLKTGGRAILQVPFSAHINNTIEEPAIKDPAKQSALFGQKDHVRIYQLHDYILRLQAAGFQVKYLTDEVLSDFHHYAIQKGEGFFSIVK